MAGLGHERKCAFVFTAPVAADIGVRKVEIADLVCSGNIKQRRRGKKRRREESMQEERKERLKKELI